jgi:hypothetical protein
MSVADVYCGSGASAGADAPADPDPVHLSESAKEAAGTADAIMSSTSNHALAILVTIILTTPGIRTRRAKSLS